MLIALKEESSKMILLTRKADFSMTFAARQLILVANSIIRCSNLVSSISGFGVTKMMMIVCLPYLGQVPYPVLQSSYMRAMQMHSSLVQRLDLEKVMEVSGSIDPCILHLISSQSVAVTIIFITVLVRLAIYSCLFNSCCS